MEGHFKHANNIYLNVYVLCDKIQHKIFVCIIVYFTLNKDNLFQLCVGLRLCLFLFFLNIYSKLVTKY